MKSLIASIGAAALIVLSIHVETSQAWGDTLAHPAIGEMAQSLLSTNGLKLVKAVLDPSFSGSLGGQTCNWADTFRTQNQWSAPWHFVDMMAAPPTSCGYNPSDCTGSGCIISAITNQTQILLSNVGVVNTQTTQALQFLAHFIGDITQPLHNCNRDLGGNNDKITYGSTSTNFHAVHDTSIPATRSTEVGASTASAYAAFLIKTYGSNAATYTSASYIDLHTADSAGNLVAAIKMANDANALDCNKNAFWALYDQNPSQDFSGSYYQATKLLLEEQIAKGGYRLAAWVNAIADVWYGAASTTTSKTSTTSTSTSTTTSTPSTTCTPSSGSSIKTVMTILLENENAADVLSDSYFGTTLKNKGYYLNNYAAVTHPSQPNYIALVAGDTLGVTSDKNVDLAQSNVADLLEKKGLTWKAYNEDYSGTCNTAATIGGAGAYARKHNPLVSFTSISGNSARCANIVSATQLDTDASNGALPNYAFYTPNLNNDGHDTDIPTASAWLKSFLEPKLVDAKYTDTLFFVVFDEGLTTSTTNQVYALLVGAGIAGVGQVDNNKYNHYSWLATVESIFGLGNLGRSDASASLIPIKNGGSGSVCSTTTSSTTVPTSTSSSTTLSSTTSTTTPVSTTASSVSSSSTTIVPPPSTSKTTTSTRSTKTKSSSTKTTKTSHTPSPTNLGKCSIEGETYCQYSDGVSDAYIYCDGQHYYVASCGVYSPGEYYLGFNFGSFCYQDAKRTAGCYLF